MKTEVEVQSSKKKSRREKIKSMLISAVNSGGQQFYFNYASLIAVGMYATPIEVSLITGIQNLGTNLLQGFFGRLSDRFGRKLILIFGFIIATITTVYLSFNSSTIIFMIVISIYSLGISMVIPSWNAFLGDIST
ncbi:MAG: MFS transporter, partial [Candidatus Heimdallarchaeaceae archaeon]